MSSMQRRKPKLIQYTIRASPTEVDNKLRQKAKKEGKSLNEVALQALAAAAGNSSTTQKKRDLSDLIGDWLDDPEFDAAIAAQRVIHPDDWK
jgi:hypothetical protein